MKPTKKKKLVIDTFKTLLNWEEDRYGHLRPKGDTGEWLWRIKIQPNSWRFERRSSRPGGTWFKIMGQSYKQTVKKHFSFVAARLMFTMPPCDNCGNAFEDCGCGAWGADYKPSKDEKA